MKKILLIANTLNYLEHFHDKLILKLSQNGFHVVTIARGLNNNTNEDKTLRHYDWPLSATGMNLIHELKSLRYLYKVFKIEKPEYVLTFTPKANIYGNLVSYIHKAPVISNISGLGSMFISGGVKKALFMTLYRIALVRAQHVFFQNEDDQEYFSRILSLDKTSILPGSGVNTDIFKPSKDSVLNARFTFLFIGRIIEDKGVHEYAEAAKIIIDKGHNARFLILGELGVDNPSALTKKEFQLILDEGYLEYLGTSNDVLKEINQSNCVVLPSYREGTPRSLLEAMSCGKLIIASDAPGCSRTVENGKNGFLCTVKSAIDLSICMERVLQLSPKQISSMEAYSREKAIREFDVSYVINAYLASLTEIK